HRPDAIAEMPPARLRHVGNGLGVSVDRARGDLVEEGLPDMRALAVEQGDPGAPMPAEAAAEPGRELEAAGAAADDDDAMWVAAGRDRRAHGAPPLPRVMPQAVMAPLSQENRSRAAWKRRSEP